MLNRMVVPDMTPGRPCFSAPLIGDWRSPVRPWRKSLQRRHIMLR